VTDKVVTYPAGLAVANEDLSLRPGMTATADIRVAESKNVFLAPSAALRFSPPAPVVGAKAAAKKSFVQSLIPMPTRGSKRPAGTVDDSKSAGTGAHIWILRDGQPVELAVKQGLSDGTHTEISGEGLAVGLVVILRANSTSP
jgi:HlyD family secretion protein